MQLTVMDTDKIKKQFERMNKMQQQAVLTTEGPLLILAGAGSGKTTVLIQRIAHILQQGLCLPYQILAITFTNKAAGELKERIADMIGDAGVDVWASTFHSFCARVLRREIENLGYNRDFSIYATDDSLRVIKDILKRLNMDEKSIAPKMVLNLISRAKDARVLPEDFLQTYGNNYLNQCIQRVYEAYCVELKDANALDFDDMILKTVELFEQFPEIKDRYGRQFHYVMVVEYQDTNPLQYQLVSLISEFHKNICVVGDDDQSIYKFRGATIENILSFENTFPGAKVIRLEQNYRSTHHILEAANHVIRNNEGRKGKNLWTASEGGEKVYLNKVANEYEESLFVTDTILDSVAKGEAKYKDFAILYRTNAQSNAIERSLVKSGVAYKVIGGVRFYDRKEIRDILSYLFLIQNHTDNLRLKRIINEPKRAIGPTTVGRVEELAQVKGLSMFEVLERAEYFPELGRAVSGLKQFSNLIHHLTEIKESGTLSQLVSELYTATGYAQMLLAENTEEAKDRLANLQEFLSTVTQYEQQNEQATLSMFLEEISLMTDVDQLDDADDRVVLMTLHSAKGLEFDNVFMVGVEEGIFPGLQSMGNPEDIEEERRLMYVGITRAKKRLYILFAAQRMLYGKTSYYQPSRFVRELPEENVERLYEERKATVASFATAQHQVPAYKPRRSSAAVTSTVGRAQSTKCADTYSIGMRVRHKAFGEGEVLSTRDMGNDTLLEIKFEKFDLPKKVMANFAKLEII
ncbi:MAG: UvrD-helicase domain-containing protein [Clostridia bacterium]|nr:UvrD-helicase domain-containing protein [Clostridia bacterium]